MLFESSKFINNIYLFYERFTLITLTSRAIEFYDIILQVKTIDELSGSKYVTYVTAINPYVIRCMQIKITFFFTETK